MIAALIDGVISANAAVIMTVVAALVGVIAGYLVGKDGGRYGPS